MAFDRLTAGRRAGVVILPAILAACGGSSTHPISPSGSASLHRLLMRGVAAEVRAGSGSARVAETLTSPGHTGYLRETIEWRRSPRELRAVAVSNLSGALQASIVLGLGDYDYLGGPSIARHLPAGKRWIRETRSQVAAATGAPLSVSRQIAELRAASSVTRVGVTTVAGAPATEYRYVLDFSRMTAKARASSMLGSLASVMRGVQIPIRLWVSASGLPVRESGAFRYHGATVRLTVTSAYGVPVDVRAPPAALVVDGGTSA